MEDPNAGMKSPYSMMGNGEDLVHRIVRSFYTHMERSEPALAQVHELDDEGHVSERTQERFGRFLVEWLGGPAHYSPREGHPRLRMRHARVPIDSTMRDAWLRCMNQALDDHGVQGEVRAFLNGRLAEVADFLRNRPE